MRFNLSLSRIICLIPNHIADMLNILDGLPERGGHVIMFDTNDLELFKMFDEAVQRRIDRYIVWYIEQENEDEDDEEQ